MDNGHGTNTHMGWGELSILVNAFGSQRDGLVEPLAPVRYGRICHSRVRAVRWCIFTLTSSARTLLQVAYYFFCITYAHAPEHSESSALTGYTRYTERPSVMGSRARVYLRTSYTHTRVHHLAGTVRNQLVTHIRRGVAVQNGVLKDSHTRKCVRQFSSCKLTIMRTRVVLALNMRTIFFTGIERFSILSMRVDLYCPGCEGP